MVGLHELPNPGRTARKRRGRGHGSGLGTYAGRGIKGQRARTGGRRGIARRSLKALFQRIPKVRGMTVAKTTKPQPVSLAQLVKHFDAGARVTRDAVIAKKLLPPNERTFVVLGGVDKLDKALTVIAHRFSASALRAIQQAGGQAILAPRPTRRPRPRPTAE
ncbi:MAG: 50S ribosomal protein L15 [Candidatus Kerfeldbacteria bacterium]|nr:50S ribosomal protein L15 [Candidatus Kerfeldbacteria bacterium]